MNHDYNKIFFSLNGYYQPQYDELPPEQIAHNYIKRKEHLYNRKLKTMDAMCLLFARENINTLTGFFKDKQNRRFDN